MRRHTPDAFDTAVQKGNIWLRDIQKAGSLRSRFQAYAALRSVLHALRDCLPPAEAVKFSAQMPLLVKGVFFDGWKLGPKPARPRRLELDDAEFKAVLSALYLHMSPAVLETIELVLPKDVRAAVKSALAGIYAREAAGAMGLSSGMAEGPAGE